MTDLKSGIEAFFDSYAAGFNRSDMNAIEKHYALPALLVHENGQIAFDKTSQVHKKLREVLSYYRQLSFRSCRYEILGMLAAADNRLVCVALRWIITRDAPLPELHFHTTYHIRRQSGSAGPKWAIVTVISFEEPGLAGNP